ncbi:quinone oxidoreductase family protein [Alteribacter keqinensis]|uniref:Alcohol dehydrogenase n=1 Tax=Alteribacter keqinensis TaxID=2483800 RepID=A0A3M7TY52_9BACI|nr:zinc-binding dehydrogenase [Alteribacter keqinensis]RNA69365.1 alcohol dehydrogenase [Alteribacter keqinensis]
MKAIVLNETGGPNQLAYQEVEKPKPAEGEVLIRLKHASLNRRDVFITHGLYPGIKLPSVLGADGSGVVAETDRADGVKKGDEVLINPGLNWGDNPHVNSPQFNILGMPSNGTYAEFVKVPVENIYKKPEYLTFQEAAALPLAAVTAYRAVVTRGNVQEGETVLIPGIGSGVALFALQIAKAKGARVFITSGSDEKIEKAKDLGAEDGVNYKKDGYVKSLREMMGSADLSIDGVGGESFMDLISLARPGGRIVNFGATTGPVPSFLLPKLFFKHLDMKGTTMGSPQDFEEMLAFFSNHKIRPVLDRSFPLEAAAEAQLYMESGKHFGKITLEIDSTI